MLSSITNVSRTDRSRLLSPFLFKICSLLFILHIRFRRICRKDNKSRPPRAAGRRPFTTVSGMLRYNPSDQDREAVKDFRRSRANFLC